MFDLNKDIILQIEMMSYNKYNDNDTFRNKELFDLDIDYIQYEDYEIDIINKLIKDKIIKGEE